MIVANNNAMLNIVLFLGRHGNNEVFRYLLALHPSTSDISKSPLFLATNAAGHTAVHEVVVAGRVDTLKTLLGSNTLLALAMVSTPSAVSGRTPLHYAVEYEFHDVVEALLKLHADVNSVGTLRKCPIVQRSDYLR
jgi:ankyrin repeat protein